MFYPLRLRKKYESQKDHHNLNVYQSKQTFGPYWYKMNKLKVIVNFCLKMAQNHNFSLLIFIEVLSRKTSHLKVWKPSIIGKFIQSYQ